MYKIIEKKYIYFSGTENLSLNIPSPILIISVSLLFFDFSNFLAQHISKRVKQFTRYARIFVMQFFLCSSHAYACTDPFKESVRFRAAKIRFAPYLLARSRSTLLLAISETRLPSAHAPPDSIVDQKLAGHFALHHSCSLGYFEATRSYRSLRDSMVPHQTRATHQTDHRRLARSTLAHFPRTWQTRRRPMRRTLVMDTDREGIPFRRAKGRGRSEGGCRHSVHRSLTRFSFFFSRDRKKKKNTPARVDSYIYSYDRVRAIGAGRAAHNDRSCERSWGRAPNRDVYACIRACTVRGRALMGPTADAAGIVRGAVSPRFKYWLTQVGFKRAWEREEGLHRSGPYQVIVCKPRAAAQSRSLFSGGCVWGRRKAPLLDDVDVPRAWHPSAKVTYYTARNTPRLRWGPMTDSRPIRGADWYSPKSVVIFLV